jgi:4-amino-4-deoxy-L-arabinose transferase-like glycosyltransferase
MKGRFSKTYPQPWSQVILLVLFCGVFFFINLNQWDLWNPDEPRYAHVAREMVDRGDWILLHFNGRTYDDKPPFFFWMIALGSFLLGGFNAFAARFPSAFFGTLTVLLTYLLGKRLYSHRTGFLGALVLATSGEFFYLATRANIDATLTFFTTAALFSFAIWDRSREDEKTRKSPLHALSIYGFYVGMALATVTKGPVGMAVPLIVVLAYLFAKKDWKAFKEMKLHWGMMLTVGLVLCWYLPAVKRGGEAYLQATLFKQTIDRYAKGWSHVKPFYYYLINFPVEFLPWSLFLPSALAYGFLKERYERRKPFFFLLTWFVAIFVLFSLSKGKRGLYLLPLYPASALMVGAFFEDWIVRQTEGLSNEWGRIPLFVLAGLMVAGAPLALWVVWRKFPAFLGWSIPMAVLLAMGGAGLLFLGWANKRGSIFLLIVMTVALGFFYTQRAIFPLINPLKSARFISQEITSRIQPGEPLAIYGGFGTGPYNYYTGIVPILELEKKEALSRFLQSPQRVFCLMKYRDYVSWISAEGREKVVFVARRQVGDDDIVLVSNR